MALIERQHDADAVAWTHPLPRTDLDEQRPATGLDLHDGTRAGRRAADHGSHDVRSRIHLTRQPKRFLTDHQHAGTVRDLCYRRQRQGTEVGMMHTGDDGAVHRVAPAEEAIAWVWAAVVGTSAAQRIVGGYLALRSD